MPILFNAAMLALIVNLVNGRVDAKMGGIDAKIGGLESRMNARFDTVDTRLDAVKPALRRYARPLAFRTTPRLKRLEEERRQTG